MVATQLMLPRQTALPPLTGPPTFGNARWIAKRGGQKIDARRIHRAAEVTVERTGVPFGPFRVVGEPEPIDTAAWWGEQPDYFVPDPWTFCDHIALDGVVVDHDPAKYAPYTDLVRDGEDTGYGYGPYYLLEMR
jgi:hypothetical protein